MLQKAARLTKKQFDEYFKTGKRWHFPHATIVYTPYSTFHGSVVVGKKLTKKAVLRNTLRRRVYATLQQAHKTTGTTGVFIVLLKPSYVTLPRKAANEEIKQNIATVIKKT